MQFKRDQDISAIVFMLLLLFRFAVAEEDHVSLRGLAQSPRVHSSESHTGNNLPFLFKCFFGFII